MDHLGPFMTIWDNVGPLSYSFVSVIAIWSNLEPFGANRSHFEPFGAIWSHLEPCVAIWDHLDFFLRGWVIFFCPERLGDFFFPERLGDFFLSREFG